MINCVKAALVVTLVVQAGCAISLDGLSKLEPSTSPGQYAKRRELAVAKCNAFYAGKVTADVARSRRTRTAITGAISFVTGGTSTVLASLSSTQTNNTQRAIAGVAAGVAAVTPLVGLVWGLFDPDIDAISAGQEKVESYLDVASTGAPTNTGAAGAPAPSGSAPTDASVDELTKQMERRYGSDYRTRALGPCVDRLSQVQPPK